MDVIRYQTKPGRADENEALIRKVFDELAASAPEGVGYTVLRIGDQFLHLVEAPVANDAISGLAAFKAFRHGQPERLAVPPAREPVTLVGSYGMFGR